MRRLGASLLVTTYQAGKLVMVRDEGDQLNTHFRTFQAPMGLAFDGSRLAVGTTIQVQEFVDVPAVTAQLEPPTARRLLPGWRSERAAAPFPDSAKVPLSPGGALP